MFFFSENVFPHKNSEIVHLFGEENHFVSRKFLGKRNCFFLASNWQIVKTRFLVHISPTTLFFKKIWVLAPKVLCCWSWWLKIKKEAIGFINLVLAISQLTIEIRIFWKYLFCSFKFTKKHFPTVCFFGGHLFLENLRKMFLLHVTKIWCLKNPWNW